MKHRFVHEFEDEPKRGDFEVGLDSPQGVRIQFKVDGQNIWLSANREGWLHLARISAEMGLHSQAIPGYHFHRSFDWKWSADPNREVTFELQEDHDPA